MNIAIMCAAVEMVWFQKEPQKAPAPEFGVE